MEIALKIVISIPPPSTKKRDHKFINRLQNCSLNRNRGSTAPPHFPSVCMGFVLHGRKLVLWAMKRDRASIETQHFLAGEFELWTKIQDHRCHDKNTRTSKNVELK